MIALIPQLGELLEGDNWDVTESQGETVGSEISTIPLEDPQRAYLIDHNQDAPAEVSVSITVTTMPGHMLGGGEALQFEGRPGEVYDALLKLKREQTTTPNALIDVYTGTAFYPNMAIRSIQASRELGTPNKLVIDVDLIEFRFTATPEISAQAKPLAANKAAKGTDNRQKAGNQTTRNQVEGTKQRRTPQWGNEERR